jgi:hypothetical protein
MASAEDYIREMRKRGFPDNQIADRLIEAGMDVDVVRLTFEKLGQGQKPQAEKTAPVTRPEDAQKQLSEKKGMEELGFVERSKAIFLEPEKFFSSPLNAPIKTSLIHFFTVALISIIIPLLAVILFFPFGDSTQYLAIAGIFIYPIVALIKLAIVSIIFFIIVKILGGQSNLTTTLKIFLYLTTFVIPLWIPLLNLLFLPFLILYIPYVTALAFSKTHKISMLRSYILLTIPIILTVLVLVIAAVVLGALILSMVTQAVTTAMAGAGGLPF